MTPTERNLRAQLDAANIQIRSLERDVRELRDAIDIKTDEIERVRVILGPTAGLRTEENTPRSDLDGRTPREMCTEHKFIDLGGKRCCYCGADRLPTRTEAVGRKP